MKVLVDAETKQILGATILGVGGDEMIHSIMDVMYAKAPYTVISRAMHIHPTVSELIPTMLQDLKPCLMGPISQVSPRVLCFHLSSKDADLPLHAVALRKTYDGKVEAVRGLDLTIETGECFGLLGPNGAGKTTTIEILEGLLAADVRRGRDPRHDLADA